MRTFLWSTVSLWQIRKPTRSSTDLASNKFAEDIAEGYNEQQSALNAALTAYISYFTERYVGDIADSAAETVIGKIPLLSNVQKSVMDSGIAKAFFATKAYQLTPYLSSMHGEGFEEVAEDILDPIADYLTLGKPIEYSFGDIMNDYMMGALSVLTSAESVVAGATYLYDGVQYKVQTARQANTIKQEIDLIDQYMASETDSTNRMLLSLARRKAQSVLSDFKNNSVLYDAVKLPSDEARTPSFSELMSIYDQAMQPTENRFTIMYQFCQIGYRLCLMLQKN